MNVALVGLCALGAVVAALAWFLLRTRSFLEPDKFKYAKLIERETITHNTKRYRFATSNGTRLGLPTGQHISFKYTDASGREVMRSYTPVTANECLGYVDFVIKVYPQGQMSQHIDNLSINDNILMRGPKGHFKYEANMKSSIGMVAGGTGVTPMYQIIRAILRNPDDRTKVSLIYANVTAADIMLKTELDAFARNHPTRLYIHYVLDNPPPGWTGGAGYVTPDMIKEHCPAAEDSSIILFCGPRPMTKLLESHAASLGFAKHQYHTF